MRVVTACSTVALLAACAQGPTSGGDPSAQPRSSASSAPVAGEVLPAPPGRRWVGAGDVVVAVPRSWGTATEACAEPQGDTVFLAGRASTVVDCRTTPTTGVSSLTVATVRSGAISLGRRVDLGAEVNGIRVLHSGLRCPASSPGPCDVTVTVPGADAVFELFVRGREPQVLVDRVLGSLTRLPSGQTTVPLVEYGTEVADAHELLRRAGLVGESPDVDFPHYITGTKPTAGTVVEVGQTVEMTIGDG
jgi:hypothetical protein